MTDQKWRQGQGVKWNAKSILSLFCPNVRRLCALLCPAISFLHFHVLQIGPSISRPSFSRPAFSAPPTGRLLFCIRYTHLDVLATHLVLVLVLRLRRFKFDRDEFRVNIRIDWRRVGFLIWRHTFKMAAMTSFREKPLSRRARVTSLACCMRYSSWYKVCK